MLIKEFRVILPLTVEEYQVAQLYSVAEASKNETGGGEGIEVLKNEPFDDYPLLNGKYRKGQYTYKIYHLKRWFIHCFELMPASLVSQRDLAKSSKKIQPVPQYQILKSPPGGTPVVYFWQFLNLPITDPADYYSEYSPEGHAPYKVPAFIRLLAPEGALEVHEEAWNAYPYCKTVISNPGYMKENFFITIETLHAAGDGCIENNPGYMKKNFLISIETIHVQDKGDAHNAHELNPEKLKMRDVVIVDISNDSVKQADFKPDEDPTKFKSVKTGRGPLIGPQWWKKCDPIMTCYKLVTVEFKWFGLQTRIEKFIQDTEKRLFTNFHRQVFCWMDGWHGMTMEDIRRLEDKTKEELDKQRNIGQVRGTRGE